MASLWPSQALQWAAEQARGRGGRTERWRALAAHGRCAAAGSQPGPQCGRAVLLVALWAALCLAATLTMLTGFCFVGTALAAQTLLQLASEAGLHTLAVRL